MGIETDFEELRERKKVFLSVNGNENIAQNQNGRNRPDFVMTLGKTDGIANAHHADNLLSVNICAKN